MYKRQAFVLTALACYLYVLVGNINNYDNIVCTPEGYGTGLRSGRWMLTLLGDTAVSYTHLDVYKRQGETCTIRIRDGVPSFAR